MELSKKHFTDKSNKFKLVIYEKCHSAHDDILYDEVFDYFKNHDIELAASLQKEKRNGKNSILKKTIKNADTKLFNKIKWVFKKTEHAALPLDYYSKNKILVGNYEDDEFEDEEYTYCKNLGMYVNVESKISSDSGCSTMLFFTFVEVLEKIKPDTKDYSSDDSEDVTRNQ